MFTTLACLVCKVTFVEVEDVTMRFESGTNERRACRESTKKLKMRGSFSGSSSSSGGPSYQGQSRVLPCKVTTSRPTNEHACRVQFRRCIPVEYLMF